MASVTSKLAKRGLLSLPPWLPTCVIYETIMGSEVYGVNNPGSSDKDIYGCCIPPKRIIFPHTAGVIEGFDKNYEKFKVWQQHHIQDKSSKKEYDFVIYGVINYFRLCMDNNPNLIDSLFTPQRCVVSITPAGELVRSNRWLFLHKGIVPKLKGYSFSQIHKVRIKNPKPGSKRAKLREETGTDTKFLYHCVRLLLQAEQVLIEHDLDLQRHREHLKAIRRGEVSEQEVFDWFDAKEKQLEKLYHESTLPWGPDEKAIKQLLLNVLETHYGSLKEIATEEDQYRQALEEITAVVNKHQSLLDGE